jgi:hypothetical protein
MNPVQSFDEHRVYYYRSVAHCARLAAHGSDLSRLVAEADYVCNPSLAPLVPELSLMPSQFTPDELRVLAYEAEGCASVEELLIKHIARHFHRADVIQCVASYYDTVRAAAWHRELAGLRLAKRLFAG